MFYYQSLQLSSDERLRQQETMHKFRDLLIERQRYGDLPYFPVGFETPEQSTQQDSNENK